MSESEESIKARFELSMFLTNHAYLKGEISLSQAQTRLIGLKNAMNEQIERFKAIEKTHRGKKRIG